MCRLTPFAEVLLLTALAASFRLFWLDRIPPGLWFDEARNIDQFANLLHGVYSSEYFDQEPLYVLFLSIGFVLKGLTPEGLRLSSAIAGIATVPAAYWFLQQTWGRRTARWSCFILAVLPWHVIFSRIGFRAVTAPLMQVLCFAFAVRTMRSGRCKDLAFVTITAATGMFSYLPFLPTPLIVALFAWIERNKGRKSHNSRKRSLHLCSAMALVVILYVPAALVLHKHAGSGLAHARVVSETNITPAQWLMPGGPPDNLLRAAEMFFWRGDPNARHNVAGHPELPAFLFPLLLAGLWREGRRRGSRSRLLLAWFVAGLVPTIFSYACPHATRAICAALPACVLVARGGIGIAGLWHQLRRMRVLSRMVPTIVGCVLVAFGAYEYFFSYGHSYSTWEAFQSASVEAAQRLDTLPPRTIVLKDPFENGTYSFDVLTGLHGLDVRPLRQQDDLTRLAPAEPAAFYYVVVGRDHFGTQFLKRYPQASRDAIFTDPENRPVGVLYRVR